MSEIAQAAVQQLLLAKNSQDSLVLRAGKKQCCGVKAAKKQQINTNAKNVGLKGLKKGEVLL